MKINRPLLIVLVFFQSACSSLYENSIEKTSENPSVEIRKRDGVELGSKEHLLDTTVVLAFHDLSPVYNYKITDQLWVNTSDPFKDSVSRKLEIYTKQGELLQTIKPPLVITPWYFPANEDQLMLSKSYINGKNVTSLCVDNYCGELVVADLNFDGLEDFATPVDEGASNGSHYAFYIQEAKGRFVFNTFLTEKVIWFPSTITDSGRTFTTEVPCGASCLMYSLYEYLPTKKKWVKSKSYAVNPVTGERLK